jgi:hypothetical protein
MSDTAKMIELGAAGGQFLDIMQNYMERQNDDPNFDPRTELYDLYDDLVSVYESTIESLEKITK